MPLNHSAKLGFYFTESKGNSKDMKKTQSFRNYETLILLLVAAALALVVITEVVYHISINRLEQATIFQNADRLGGECK